MEFELLNCCDFLLILIHLLRAESPRRYQQHEEKEGLEKSLCFHDGMVC